MNNKKNEGLSESEMLIILQFIAIIRGKLSFLIDLEQDEKKLNPILNNRRIHFTKMALERAILEPSQFPDAFLVKKAQNNFDLFYDLEIIDNELTNLAGMISDTRMLAITSAYKTARDIYKMDKLAASKNITLKI